MNDLKIGHHFFNFQRPPRHKLAATSDGSAARPFPRICMAQDLQFLTSLPFLQLERLRKVTLQCLNHPFPPHCSVILVKLHPF